MTRDELARIVRALKAIYTKPDFIPDQAAFDVWYMLLMDLDFAPAQKAVVAYMSTNHFAPTPADIRALAAEQSQPPGMSSGEAWGKVLKAIANSLYCASEEFNKLPPECQKVVGCPDVLREWAQMDASTVNSVTASNFKKSYDNIIQEMKTAASLPPQLAAGKPEALAKDPQPAQLSE